MTIFPPVSEVTIMKNGKRRASDSAFHKHFTAENETRYYTGTVSS